MTNFFNLSASPDGATLALAINGVIDPAFGAEDDTSSAEIAAQLQANKGAKQIDVHINSVGGSLAGGVALFNLLRAHGAQVTTYTDGLAASAASVIFMAGDRRVMGLGSMLMVHLPQAATLGDANDHRQAADMLDVAADALATIYVERTGKSLDEITTMLAEETWMTAEDAVAQGFATEVASDGAPLRVAAQADGVMVAGALFNRASLPPQILALAVEPKADPFVTSAPVEAVAPVSIAATVRNAVAQAVAEERVRVDAILKLPITDAGLVHAAISEGLSVEATIARAWQADQEAKLKERSAMAARLEARARESAIASSIGHVDPAPNKDQREMAAARNIAAMANNRKRR